MPLGNFVVWDGVPAFAGMTEKGLLLLLHSKSDLRRKYISFEGNIILLA